jgi:lysyl-tRNA synthetase class 2
VADFHHPHAVASLPAGTEVRSAGRLVRRGGDLLLADARGRVRIEPAEDSTAGERSLPDRSLVRLSGTWTGTHIFEADVECVHTPEAESSLEFPEADDSDPLGSVLEMRAEALKRCRQVFEARDFRHVETPHLVSAPGTDLYIDPIKIAADATEAPAWLHTSPEFAMKRLLSEGCTRIWQHCRVWRGGERTGRHHPEFSMLEWYRAWESAEAIIDDIETVVTRVCGDTARVAGRGSSGSTAQTISLEPPFDRITMRALVDDVCGFDLLDALDYPSLRDAIAGAGLLERSLKTRHRESDGRWDELFFEMMVTELEPALRQMGAVFVTEWPAPLAVLAKKHDDDPRVAERFELFVGGLELANGFVELTDPDEQRKRFETERAERKRLEKPQLPVPKRLLQSLRYGMPPSAGVALGFDRLLMAATGAPTLAHVSPFVDPTSNP